ncbi:MAG: molybdopterin-dependent oxidoreductase [Cyclobacteriaceae bacterium]|nr:molybdopterin-dependent oxidoreductase [Cyclobacteriaceae bacterium]
MKIQRRDFIKTITMGGTGFLVFSPSLGAFAKTNKTQGDSDEEWLPSTCQGCTTWCPIEICVQNGRAIKVRGNQHSLVNPGYVCPRGHMIPQILYDPDRIKTPLKRTNSKKGRFEDPNFVPITWDEALDTIADQIIALRNNGESHKFGVFRGRYTYMRDILYSALPKIVGSPNGISHSSICAEAEKSGAYFTEAYWDYRDYDLANTKCCVLWGVDPTRSNRQVPGFINKFPDLLDRASVITIDPMLTTVASKSKYWLPVKPGYDGALASAIAHEILVSGSWNKEFVGDFKDGNNLFTTGNVVDESLFQENYSNGLVKWWNLELMDKPASWAESVCGISASVIQKVTMEMAQAAPRVIVWLGPGPVMSPKGTYTAMAIHCLNGLLGSADNMGGTIRYVKQKTKDIPSVADYQDDIAKAGAKYPKIDQRGTFEFPALNGGISGGGVVTNNLPDAMLAEDPYDMKAVIGYWNNFNFSCAGTSRWDEAMAKLPFFAHITTHAAEMTRFADIVLPAAFHAAERWAYVKNFGNTYSSISIQQPIVERMFDVYADENEITWKLAVKLKEKGFSNLYDYYHNEFADPETGAKPTNEHEFALYTTKYLTKPSWDLISGGWDGFKEKGVVNFGPYVYRSKWENFGTVTGKFEFYSETLKKALEGHAKKHDKSVDEVLEACNYEARGDLAFVPHFEAPNRWGDVSEYPLDFIDGKSRLSREGRSQNNPWFYGFKRCDPGDENQEDLIKMNPLDAKKYGIKDGDTVKLTSVEGFMTGKVKLWEGIRPGTVTKTYGMGHSAYGKFACEDFALGKARGTNNNDFLPVDYDRLSGSTARNGGFTGVRVE